MFLFLLFKLLIKPIKYRLVLGELTAKQSANLKVLASVLLYVGRRAVNSMSQILVRHEKEKEAFSCSFSCF